MDWLATQLFTSNAIVSLEWAGLWIRYFMVTEDAYSSTLGLLNAEINKTKTRNKNRKIFNLRKLQEKWQIMHVKAFNAT